MNCGIDQSYVNIAGEDGNIEPFEDAPRLNSSLTLRLKRKYTAASKHRRANMYFCSLWVNKGLCQGNLTLHTV